MQFFSISVRQLFACWRSLGSYPGLEICSSLQVYAEVEVSGSQLGEKKRESFVLSGWGSMRQHYIESATALSDITLM